MTSENQPSIGDENTLQGEKTPAEERSLGDRSTYLGSEESSLSDAAGELGLDDHDMEIVDLSKRYRIEKSLGKGGMGEVLLATDTRLDRQVAIKRIRADIAVGKTAAARFLTEAKAVAALNHNNVVSIHDYGRDANGPFLIMEYVSGGSLLQRCKQGPIELEQAIDIACQLCGGLGRAHDAGIIHRDIKPANILLTDDGTPKLTDFGLAKADSRDHTMTMPGAVLGTLDFMPPEQRRDAALTDSRSDLWSLAATLYQMITGESPRVIDLDLVPQQLRVKLSQALKTEKEDRYQTASDLRDALKDSLQDSGTDISDIGEGECPHCRTKNDSSRKFCRSCAGSLEAPCLSCSVGIPMWENVCGNCGAKQEDLLQERREAMDAKKLQAENLSADFRYAAATHIAEEIGSESDLRLQHLKSWSERFIADCEKQRQRELTRASEFLGEALIHEKAHDYPSGIKALTQVPETLQSEQIPGRSETVAAALSRLRGKESEVEQRHQVIRTRVNSGQLNGLLEDVENLLQLIPHHEDLRRLQDQLINRNEKMQQVRQASFQEALEAMDSQNYPKCLSALSKIDPYVENDEIRYLRKEAEQKQQRLTELQDHIRTSIAQDQYDGLLDDVLACLALWQGNTELEKLRDQLIERSEKQSVQMEAVLAKVTHLRAQCKFEAAIKSLNEIPVFLRNENVATLMSDCQSLAYLRSEAISALQSEIKSEAFAKGLEDSSDYQSMLDSDHLLQDAEFLALRRQVEIARNLREEVRKAKKRQKERLIKIWISVGSSVAAVLLVIAVMWQMSVQRANKLASALEGERWEEVLAMEPENVTALIGRVNQKLVSGNPDLDWILAEVDTIKSLDPVNTAVKQINGKVYALQSIAASAVGDASTGEAKIQQAKRLNVDTSYLDRANKSLAVAYAKRAESAVAAGSITSAVAFASKAMSFDSELSLPATVTIALAQSRASEMVNAYVSDPSDANRDAAEESLNALESLPLWSNGLAGWSDGLTFQSRLLLSLRSKMQAIELADAIGLAESRASEMVSTYEADPSDTNRDAAVASINDLEKLNPQSTVLASLRGKPSIILAELVVSMEDAIKRQDFDGLEADYQELNRLDSASAQKLTSFLSALPSPVLSNLPLTVLSNLPPSVIVQLPPTINSIGMPLKPIPLGTFTMGDGSYAHQVTLTKAFMLSVHEVTQFQFERVMGSNPSRFIGPQSPVGQVSWEEAMEFCRKLSSLPLERAAGRVYRLPTEAEWEYACRAGTTTEYGFGDDASDLGQYAWYGRNSGDQTHPVGQKKPNAWGLYDMHGNVWEWCADRYTDLQSGEQRVFRGGSFYSPAESCRSADRDKSNPWERYHDLGFRVTCVPSGQ